MEQLHTTLLLPTELITAGDRILGIVSVPGQPFMTQLGAVIRKDIVALSGLLARERTSAHTRLLLEKDQVRDSAFVAVRDLVRSASRRTDPAVGAAGRVLWAIFERHGLTLYRLGYAQQSAKLKALLDELDASASAVKASGAEASLAELKAAQAAFEDTFQNKVNDESRQDFPELAEARQTLASDLALLLECVEILPRLDPPVPIAEIESKLDTVITEIMAPARARQTRGEKEGTAVAAPAVATS